MTQEQRAEVNQEAVKILSQAAAMVAQVEKVTGLAGRDIASAVAALNRAAAVHSGQEPPRFETSPSRG